MGDLSRFDTRTKANDGVEMELRLIKGGSPSGVFLKLLGRDSDEFRSAMEDNSRTITERVAAGMPSLTQEQRSDMECELLSRCTTGWRNLEEKGAPLVFSRSEAKRVYAQYPAIMEQANIFIGDRANFTVA